MKVIVTGLESSGTRWMTELLDRHPHIDEVIHTSIPEHPGEFTRWPDLTGANFIVWMVRSESVRRLSLERLRYDDDRAAEFRGDAACRKAVEMFEAQPVQPVVVSYEELVGPFGHIALRDLFWQLCLSVSDLPEGAFKPVDGNAKYLKT